MLFRSVSLFYTDREGWTNFTGLDAEGIDRLISKGAEYLFISNENTLQEEFLKPYISDPIGSFEGIEIFKLKSPTSNL